MEWRRTLGDGAPIVLRFERRLARGLEQARVGEHLEMPQRPRPRAALGPSMVACAIRSVFEQPDGTSARDELGRVLAAMARRYRRVASLLTEAEPDQLSHFAFPETH